MLSQATGKAAAFATAVPSSPQTGDAVGVWPHMVTESYQETDNKGRLKTKRKHFIELRNETGRPVVDVSLQVPEEMSGLVLAADTALARMAPNATERFPLVVGFGERADGECVVKWRFDGDEPRETRASIRL